MQVLVVVYSYTGTSAHVARSLAALQRWPLGEIRDAQPRCGGEVGILRCLVDSLFLRRPEVTYHGPDPGDFDAVVLVSPIWALRLAGPMRTFVAARRADLPAAAVISVMGSSGAHHAVAEIARLTGRAPLAEAAIRTAEADGAPLAARLRAFAHALEQALQREPARADASRERLAG